MLKKTSQKGRQDDLFQARLENIISPRHELVKLAALIDWNGLESYLCCFYCVGYGRVSFTICLLVSSRQTSAHDPQHRAPCQ